MGSVVLPLTALAGGAALLYLGITNPAGGAWAGLGNLLHGQPNTTASTTSLVADLATVGGSGSASAAPYTGAAAPASGARAKVLAEAQTWLGVPYVFGGNTRHGVDCSGFTLQVFATVGVHLPRVSMAQALVGRRTLSPQPGDLVCFGSPVEHVGIYLGNGRMIDAPHTGAVVRVEAVDYGVHPITYRDVLGGKAKARTKRRRRPVVTA